MLHPGAAHKIQQQRILSTVMVFWHPFAPSITSRRALLLPLYRKTYPSILQYRYLHKCSLISYSLFVGTYTGREGTGTNGRHRASRRYNRRDDEHQALRRQLIFFPPPTRSCPPPLPISPTTDYHHQKPPITILLPVSRPAPPIPSRRKSGPRPAPPRGCGCGRGPRQSLRSRLGISCTLLL